MTVTLPRLTSVGAVALLVGTGVVALAAVVVLFVTQPANRWAAAVVGALLVLAALAILTHRRRLDPATGRLEASTLGLRRCVELGPTTHVSLVTNRAGGLLLRAAPAHGRAVLAQVLVLSDSVERSLEPGTLVVLADTLETHGAAGAAPVAKALRAQAAHLAAGGAPRTSPLAPRITLTSLRAGQAGGAGGVAGGL